MKKFFYIPSISFSLLILPYPLLSGQDQEQSGGGSESAAEASVSGSAAKKALGAPESAESSPLIVVAKAGLSLDLIVATSKDKLRAVTSVGDATKLKNAIASVKSGTSNFNDIVDIAVDSVSSGVSIDLEEIQGRAEIVQTYRSSGLSAAELAVKIAAIKNPSSTVNISAEKKSAKLISEAGSDGQSILEFQTALATNSVSASHIPTILEAYSSIYSGFLESDTSSKNSFLTNITSAFTGNYKLVDLVRSRAQLDSTNDELSDPITAAQIVKFHPDVLAEFVKVTDSDARFGLFDLYYNLEARTSPTLITTVNPEIIAFADLANDLFTDQILGGTNTLSGIDAVDLNYITTKSPAQRLLNYLAQYNILGFNNDSKGDSNLVSALPTDLFSRDNSNADITQFAEYLALYSTVRDSDGNLVTLGRDLGDNDLSDYKIPLSNITLYPGKNITLSGTLDVSSELSEATLTNNNVNPEDIRIGIIGAANDVTISNDLTITNNNKVEDHALVIAAADDLVIAQGKKVEYQGSNLALGSGDTMYLVDVDIVAGGNVAIGTLNDLHITSGSTINAGLGGNTPNSDLVLLYANDLLNLDNVNFAGNIREIHMDASRVKMKNITLPANSFLKINTPGSRKWQNAWVTVQGTSLQFSGSASTAGAVVLENVTHPNVGVLNASNLPEVGI
jgi:hypothetical protein